MQRIALLSSATWRLAEREWRLKQGSWHDTPVGHSRAAGHTGPPSRSRYPWGIRLDDYSRYTEMIPGRPAAVPLSPTPTGTNCLRCLFDGDSWSAGPKPPACRRRSLFRVRAAVILSAAHWSVGPSRLS